MEKQTESVIMSLIMVSMLVFESLEILLSIPTKGFLKDRRMMLLKKTNKELKNMLVGVKKISNLNKVQLVDLVIAQAI